MKEHLCTVRTNNHPKWLISKFVTEETNWLSLNFNKLEAALVVMLTQKHASRWTDHYKLPLVCEYVWVVPWDELAFDLRCISTSYTVFFRIDSRATTSQTLSEVRGYSRRNELVE